MIYTLVYELPDDPKKEHEHEFEAAGDAAAIRIAREFLAQLSSYEWATLYDEAGTEIDIVTEVLPKPMG